MHDATPDDGEQPAMPDDGERPSMLAPPADEADWPHAVVGFDDLPEHLRQAVIDAPGPSPELADRLRALIPITPPPADYRPRA